MSAASTCSSPQSCNERVAKAPRFRGNPFLPAYAGQKFLPPNIPLGTKLSAEPRTRRKAARTLSALNFPVCVPSIRTCRLDGTFSTVCCNIVPLACPGLACPAGGFSASGCTRTPRRRIHWGEPSGISDRTPRCFWAGEVPSAMPSTIQTRKGASAYGSRNLTHPEL